jgi:predicted acylesterase/phospholipase RssA
MAPLRLSLTIPGAVSLGAYEGGALAALITAVKALGEETVVIDSIASASAGSITGLLTARSLLRGVDAVELLKAAWVENVSFQAMKAKNTDSPLNSDALTQMATEVLGAGGVPEGPEATWQKVPVRLSMALASLAGLTYRLPDLVRQTTMDVSTFLDFYNITLTNSATSDDYVRHAQAAIASGSNAIGFPPKRLDRSGDRATYEATGLQGFPADGQFWYTDGGTVDNEPLGRTIDLAQSIGSDDDRLFLLIHPDPSFPPSSPSPVWGGDAPLPPWVRTATHVLSMESAQSIYEDLKTLQKTNSRLQWIDKIASAVCCGLETGLAGAGVADAVADRIRGAVTSSIGAALGEVRQGQADVAHQAGRPATEHLDAGPTDCLGLLDALVRAASGLEDRQPTTVEVVSPVIDPDVPETPATQLAGAFFFHFGGFFDVKFRQSDFALGFRNMHYWLQHNLGPHLPGVVLDPALDKVTDAYDGLGWDAVRWGGANMKDLSFTEKAELAELALHVGHVVAKDATEGGI